MATDKPPTAVHEYAADSSEEETEGHGADQLPAIDWTDEEEKKLVRKLDFILMPLLIAGSFVMQLDRVNIGNALTDYFLADVGITQLQFNTGQQLLSLGIVLMEIPSNLVLYRVGPATWIGCQILLWGLVATFQAFQKGVAVFYTTRLLLGLLEAGFVPAGLFLLTQWYKRTETSGRYAAYFLGSMIASAANGLIAYGILHMRGVAGLAGWQWMFLIEGMVTVVVGIVFWALVPHSPARPQNVLGYVYFTKREVDILVQRIILEDPGKGVKRKYIQWGELRAAFSNWHIYPHLGITFCSIAVIGPLSSYAPSIIASFGFGRLEANALSSVDAWAVIGLTLLWGWAADKTQRRGPLILLAVTLSWIFALTLRLVITHPSRDVKYAILTLAKCWVTISHPLNGSWIAINTRVPAERCIIMALFIMTANTASLAGAQIFQARDSPVYRVGFSVILALNCGSLLFAIITNLQYFWLNKRLDREEKIQLNASEQIEQGEQESVERKGQWRFSG